MKTFLTILASLFFNAVQSNYRVLWCLLERLFQNIKKTILLSRFMSCLFNLMIMHKVKGSERTVDKLFMLCILKVM